MFSPSDMFRYVHKDMFMPSKLEAPAVTDTAIWYHEFKLMTCVKVSVLTRPLLFVPSGSLLSLSRKANTIFSF